MGQVAQEWVTVDIMWIHHSVHDSFAVEFPSVQSRRADVIVLAVIQLI